MISRILIKANSTIFHLNKQMMSVTAQRSANPSVVVCSVYFHKKLVDHFKESFPDGNMTALDMQRPLDESSRNALSKAEIVIADPEFYVKYHKDLKAVNWVQLSYAGIDHLMKNLPLDWKEPTYTVCRYGGCLGTTIAEYVVGQIISRERFFPALSEEQKKHSWQMMKYGQYRQMCELTLGVIGAGDIGSEIARCCKCFGMKTLGIVRRELPREKRSPYVDEYRVADDLPYVLAESDYIVSVLPSTPATRGFYSGNVFSQCTKKPVFINVGRGDCISQETIINSIKNSWLSGAILDVTDPEPLPADSPLWEMPEVTITPHTSGYTVEHQFIQNFVNIYQKYLDGEDLPYQIDWHNAY